MNRKTFLKSIAGLIGLAATAPAVLIAKPTTSTTTASTHSTSFSSTRGWVYPLPEGYTVNSNFLNTPDAKEVLEMWRKTGILMSDVKNLDFVKKIPIITNE